MSPFFYSYLITDPKEYGNTNDTLKQSLIKSFSNHKIDMLCFRDKETSNMEPLAKTTLEVSKQFGIKKVLINGNIQLALKLGFDGVHLTSNQFDEIQKAKKNNLFTIISCHNEQELKQAKILGANGASFSPIFYKENKNNPIGCDKLQSIVKAYQEDGFMIIALGGIVSKKNIQDVKKTKCSAFASIRYFVN